MISRRLVRVKAMQTYYSILQNNEEEGAEKAWNSLERSLNKSYELFISMHCLLIQLCDFANSRIEIKKNKYLATEEDLNPNMRFVENKIIEAFRKNAIINKAYCNFSSNWSDCPEIIKSIWTKVEKADFYKEYMLANENSLKNDMKIIVSIINVFLANSAKIDDYLEDKSIYWNDELELILSNIINDLQKIKADSQYNLSPMYKQDEDEDFARLLISKTVRNTIRFDGIISETLKRWELERVAFVDRVILHLALTEILEMPDMPIPITLNEWLEIAKFYSTDKSSQFLNGLLDKIYIKLKTENKISK